MGLFIRRQPTAAPVVAPVDLASASPERWLAESETAYNRLVDRYYGTPETMANGGHERLNAAEAGVALHFFAKSIDMLHTAYGYDQMQRRRPSDHDAAIVGGFCDALALVKRDHGSTPFAAVVREVTHRLRSISTRCDGAGYGSNLYRWGLDTMARLAPEVRTDDVFWH